MPDDKLYNIILERYDYIEDQVQDLLATQSEILEGLYQNIAVNVQREGYWFFFKSQTRLRLWFIDRGETPYKIETPKGHTLPIEHYVGMGDSTYGVQVVDNGSMPYVAFNVQAQYGRYVESYRHRIKGEMTDLYQAFSELHENGIEVRISLGNLVLNFADYDQAVLESEQYLESLFTKKDG